MHTALDSSIVSHYFHWLVCWLYSNQTGSTSSTMEFRWLLCFHHLLMHDLMLIFQHLVELFLNVVSPLHSPIWLSCTISLILWGVFNTWAQGRKLVYMIKMEVVSKTCGCFFLKMNFLLYVFSLVFVCYRTLNATLPLPLQMCATIISLRVFVFVFTEMWFFVWYFRSPHVNFLIIVTYCRFTNASPMEERCLFLHLLSEELRFSQ